MKNESNPDTYFPENIEEAFIDDLSKLGVCKIRDLKELLTVKNLASPLPFPREKSGLLADTLHNLKQSINPPTTPKTHIETLKNLEKKLKKLCQEAIEERTDRINSIIEKSDKVTTLVMLAVDQGLNIPIENLSLSDNLNLPETNSIWIDNFSTLTNRKKFLKARLSQLNSDSLKRAESFRTAFFSEFKDNDLVDYIETVIFDKKLTIACTHKSLNNLDLLRIKTELTYIKDHKSRDTYYKRIIEGFQEYKKNLKKLKNLLTKINKPEYSELKECIINNGFPINSKTGMAILTSPERADVIKKIKTIENRIKQRKTRKEDTQKQLNFAVYQLNEDAPNPCNIIKNKTKTINMITENFLDRKNNKSSTQIIEEKKNLDFKRSNRQITIRMPAPLILKTKRKAKKHNITVELLLNIIIQHHLKDTTPSENSSPKEQPVAVDTEVNQPPSQPKKKFNFHSNTPAPKKRKVSTRF